MKAQHTSGEWEARQHINGSHWFIDAGPVGERVTIMDELSEGDALRIVLSCNVHEALLHMLNVDLVRVKDLMKMIPEQAGMWNAWAQDINKAIDKAQGRAA